MAFATIQITQGAIVGGNGESVVGLDTTTTVTLTDAGGAGATSYLWEIISFPAPDASAPSITDSNLQVATVPAPGGAFTDGVYLVRLTRDDPGDGISTDVKFFAVEDLDGISLPSPGQNRNNSNVGGSAAAQEAGWFGSVAGGTNVFLDAFLRLRRLREGRFFGTVGTFSHTLGTPVVDNYQWGLSLPLQELALTGAGTYTANLVTTGAESGAVFRFQVSITAGAGDFAVTDAGGPTIFSVAAPPSGTIRHEVIAYYDGTDWLLASAQTVSPALLSLLNEKEFLAVAGVQSSSEATYQRAGTVRVDPTLLPSNAQMSFEASFDTTDAGNAALVQLYNVTDAVVVGSAFSTTSTTNQTQSAVVTLPAGLRDYEVQVRLTSADPAERATVTRAAIVGRWG